MYERSFFSSKKAASVWFFSPLGIAETKRFFHHGLLRSLFSSSLSFLSSTWEISKNILNPYRDILISVLVEMLNVVENENTRVKYNYLKSVVST